MYRVAKRVEDRGDFRFNLVIVPPDVRHRQHNVHGKSPGAIHANPLCVRAEVTPARQTIAATAASYVAFSTDQLTRMKIGDIRADRYNFSDKFMLARRQIDLVRNRTRKAAIQAPFEVMISPRARGGTGR